MDTNHTPLDNSLRVINKRLYGIDALKIICMCLVPILHILGHGGIIKSLSPVTLKYEVASFMQIVAYCAVNCFAIITGFVSYDKSIQYKNLFNINFQVTFYTLSTTAFYLIYDRHLVDTFTLVSSLIPVLYDVYWYFSAYFCLFFIIPYINRFIKNLSKEQCIELFTILFLVFSFLPTLSHYDFTKGYKGYSFLWIALMYSVGAVLRKYYSLIYNNRQVNKYISIFFISVFVTWCSKFFIENITLFLFKKAMFGNYLISYNSPTIIINAIMLVLYYSQKDISGIYLKFIKRFTPASFGVYLFHEEPLIRKYLISGAFSSYANYSPLCMGFAILITAIIIFLFGSSIDLIRIKMFGYLGVGKLSCYLDENLKRCISCVNLSIKSRSK